MNKWGVYHVIMSFVFVLLSENAMGGVYNYVQIQNSDSQLCLQIKNSSKATQAPANQAPCLANALTSIQSFYASVNSDGSYTFRNRVTGLCLEVKDAALGMAVPIQQNICSSLSEQRFTPKYVANNQYLLISQLDGGCFVMQGASKEIGAPLVKHNCRENLNYRFSFKILSGTMPLFLPAFNDPIMKSVGGPTLPTTLKGVNITGAESGDLTDNNVMFKNYAFPSLALIDYFAEQGFTTIRFPFKRARLQPKLSGAFDLDQLEQIDKVVQYARKKGIWIVLDPHDYGAMQTDAPNRKKFLIGSKEIPAIHFANFWGRLARIYAKQPNVIFNIMNEPSSQKNSDGVMMYMRAPAWQSSAIAAVSAIRSQGASQLILIPGVSWTGAHSWVGSKNAQAWTYFHDSRYAFDVHQYLDKDSSGTHDVCSVGAGASEKRLGVFTAWATQYRKLGFIGELGWAENATCLKEGKDMMAHIKANAKVYRGWTYFGAGWYAGFMSLNPKNLNKTNEQDRLQLKTLVDSL